MFRHVSMIAVLATTLATPLMAEPVRNPLTESESWDFLHGALYEDVEIKLSNNVMMLEAPYRAHDAATVPITLRQTDPDVMITSATVVIDENPSPVAGEFVFSDAMAPIEFEMRVRVDQYSNVRVIADTGNGLEMSGRFVKASGGCSAPATRDPVVALESMGEMRLRLFDDVETTPKMSMTRREAQIMIRHPNYSGLQRDQVTHLFVPAHFISDLEVWQGDEMLFTMEGGISISENPVFRFSYRDNGTPVLTVKATDTEGNVFEQQLAKELAG